MLCFKLHRAYSCIGVVSLLAQLHAYMVAWTNDMAEELNEDLRIARRVRGVSIAPQAGDWLHQILYQPTRYRVVATRTEIELDIVSGP
ncbi:hypothetical protein F5B19DRAFT_444226 [Rostrohypoxylon terebratum]|nr:hypothetical protein F5B19DRAFT_444226 [Rostrohypoxylon terebratum]